MHRDRKYTHLTYLIVDILLIGFSFYLPYCFRYNRRIIPGNLPYFRDYCLLFFLWGISLIFLLNNYHLYSTDRSLTIPKETGRAIKCVVFASVLAAVAIFLLQMKFFSRLVFGWAAVLLVINLSFWRAIKRILIRYRITKGHYNINVLIVGAGRAGYTLAEEIKNNPYLGLKVIGFLDDAKFVMVPSYNILGKISELERIVQQQFVDEIYVTIPSERKKVSEVLTQAKKLKKTVRVLADKPESNNRYPLSFSRLGNLYRI